MRAWAHGVRACSDSAATLLRGLFGEGFQLLVMSMSLKIAAAFYEACMPLRLQGANEGDLKNSHRSLRLRACDDNTDRGD